MPTTFKNAVNKYFRARNLKPGTRSEYLTTVAKWQKWNGGVAIERLEKSNPKERFILEEKQEILAKLGLWEDWKAVDQKLKGMN